MLDLISLVGRFRFYVQQPIFNRTRKHIVAFGMMLWSVVSTYRANYSMPSAHRGVTMSMTTQRGVCSLLHPSIQP